MHTPTILVIEDNPDHLELALCTLEECALPHEVISAPDGQQALDYLFGEGRYYGRDTETQPEMVLLDIKLPKITGADVLQRMRDDHRTFFVPVVLLATSHDQVNEVKNYIGGLTSFLKKPMMPRDVEGKLQEVREYWRTSRFSPLSF